MPNIQRLNQEFEANQLAMQSRATAQVALQELETLSPEPENPATEVDTRPIWPGRIELIYQAYLAENTTWLAANPTVRPTQYRTKRGLLRWTKAVCNGEMWQLPRQRINLETETLIEGPASWKTEEVQAWLDWEQRQEQDLERQLDTEYAAAGGFGSESRRGIGHIHRQLQAESDAERSQYRFCD
ncbi:hypothetical protein POJ06DRAFT_234429 [Lipomyces tetrasporus]|uniref:Uncharacterized protein n=1 Tax=Lipomyces tetrasporus TaxID=54092 RepID=A0AAD7VVD6_9ASCO|nr:uncharacterized protein POJ06DRAFT_234429 [Lipomyces tetrasporus]KAJ8103403.1 hypothetical protein POJ06DRAFT_234429 [Lipomyces tetrasporus]